MSATLTASTAQKPKAHQKKNRTEEKYNLIFCNIKDEKIYKLKEFSFFFNVWLEKRILVFEIKQNFPFLISIFWYVVLCVCGRFYICCILFLHVSGLFFIALISVCVKRTREREREMFSITLAKSECVCEILCIIYVCAMFGAGQSRPVAYSLPQLPPHRGCNSSKKADAS